jgi:ankyrin repeat protein
MITGILDNIISTESTEFTNENSLFYKIYNDLPLNDLNDYITEYNLNHQTPLMYASYLNKLDYVQQLIPYDVCRIDDFNKTALDYAIDESIRELLAQYETTFESIA